MDWEDGRTKTGRWEDEGGGGREGIRTMGLGDVRRQDT